MVAVDLVALEQEIAQLGETLKSLKAAASGDIDKAAIAAAVAALLAAKKQYAENNNGIGVDGLAFAETKAQKKKAAKSTSAEADPNESAAEASNGKQDADPNSKGALKKAAKKAEAAAKRAEFKKGDSTTPTANAATLEPPVATPSSSVNASSPSLPPLMSSAPIQQQQLRPNNNNSGAGAGLPHNAMEIVMNPNVPLTERPIVALSVAVLSNTVVDWRLVSDHKCRRCALGVLANGNAGVVVAVAGDFAMARYLAKRAGARSLLSPGSKTAAVDDDAIHAAVVDTWVDDAIALVSVSSNNKEQRLTAIALTLEHALHPVSSSSSEKTYLVGTTLSLADLAWFWAAGFCTQAADLRECLQLIPEQAVATRRWLTMMASHPALQEATQLCLGVGHGTTASGGSSSSEAVFDESLRLDPLVPGMNALEGAVAGRVVTRFPPEPSGYLHIGHAKAVLLNDYYAKRYKGRLIVRFDDTNPSKEKEEYQESIVQDLEKLGVRPDAVTYTSDYFETIAKYARFMMQNGFAYMDDTPQEQMKQERADLKDSKHRNQTTDEALKYFDNMCSGSEEGGKWCLRAKIDMKSANGTMRDPVLFRQNLTPHHRSGKTFKAYPTYDLACPIVDSLEGVTHALRTTEYDDRNDQYHWIQRALGLRRVRVHTFSRVNFKFTVLSKRKLTWFVEKGLVTGWDDARFPTIRGVIRRGINVQSLRQFMYSQGSSKNIVLMNWNVFWSENKKEIDKHAKRFMAVNVKGDNAQLTITNAPDEAVHAYVETSCHPKDPSLGNRTMRISNRVLLETVDIEGIEVGEEVVLMRWGVVKIVKVEGTEITGEFVVDGDFKAAKRKLSWLANVKNNTPVTLMEFDNLISKEKLEEDEEFENFINPDTLAATDVIGDAGLKTLREHDIIQLERRGYYRVDRPYINESKPIILFMIPDGKTKSMSGQTGKLAHR